MNNNNFFFFSQYLSPYSVILIRKNFINKVNTNLKKIKIKYFFCGINY